MYYPFVRKALFQLDPERAHEVTFQQLRRVTGTPLEMLVRQKVPARPVTCMGLTFKNPLGLAAGLDKNGECIDALGAMGFGSIEIGTVTPRPQPGNDKPRIFRLVDAEGLINRMGFNNHGVDNLVENVNTVLGMDASDRDRNAKINQLGQATVLRQYTHWIESIEYGDLSVSEGADEPSVSLIKDLQTNKGIVIARPDLGPWKAAMGPAWDKVKARVGADNFKPPIDNVDAAGVFTMKTPKDAVDIDRKSVV